MATTVSETPTFDAVKEELGITYFQLATDFRRLPDGEVEAKYAGKWVNVTNETPKQ